MTTPNLTMLGVYVSRIQQLEDELAIVADSEMLPLATKTFLNSAKCLLKDAREAVYSDAFIIVVGAKIQFSPATNWHDEDLNPTIIQITVDRNGGTLIEYSTGMFDTPESLLEKLVSGLATISEPSPEISLGKNEGCL